MPRNILPVSKTVSIRQSNVTGENNAKANSSQSNSEPELLTGPMSIRELLLHIKYEAENPRVEGMACDNFSRQLNSTEVTMALQDALTILKVRSKSYILFYAGMKRRITTYDAMAPDGSTVATSVSYDAAVEACQLHYVVTSPPSGRRSKTIVKKHGVQDIRKLNYGNDAMSDKANLADYAEWSFDDTDIDMQKYQRGLYES